MADRLVAIDTTKPAGQRLPAPVRDEFAALVPPVTSAGITDLASGRAPLLTGDIAAARNVLAAASAVATKEGDPWWNTVFAAPSEIPTITSATSSQISGGSTISPTADYNYDPYFRYDGCAAVQINSGGVSSVYGAPEMIIPETITDAQNIEVVFDAYRGGTASIAVRVIVDGKFSHLQMLRFDAVSGTTYYYRHQFTTRKVRHLKFEIDAMTRFRGLVVGSYSVLQRPKGPHRSRLIAIGDSLTAGDVLSLYYGPLESHSRFQAALMGCDSYINLGIGGTGWLNPGASTVVSVPFDTRIPQALLGNPQILGFFGSRNDRASVDASYTPTAVRAAVAAGLDKCADVPIILVSGPQQTLTDTDVNDAVRQGVVAAGRKFLDLQGSAAGVTSNPTGHPTFAEQLNIAKVAHSQVDMTRILSVVEGVYAAKQPVAISLVTSPATAANTGASVTLTATVTGMPSAIIGSVQFFDNGVPLGTSAVSGGTASLTTSSLSIATHSLTARFLPANPAGVKFATSTPVALTISANLGVTDLFNRADGAVGNSDNGKAWNTTTSSGAWVISGNMLANPTAAGNSYANIDCGTPWGNYEFTMGGTYGTATRLLCFYQDANNHVFLDCSGGTNNWRLYTRIATTATAVATGATGAGWVAGDVIRIEVTHGSTSTKANIVVKKNGSTVLTATDVELSSLATNTKLAFGVTSATNTAKLDAVTMTAA